MALDFAAPMTALVTLLKTIPGLENDVDGTEYVTVGVPDSVEADVRAFVCFIGPRLNAKATRLEQVEAGYYVEFNWKVGGDQATAESNHAAYLAQFIGIMLSSTGRRLSGLQINGVDVDARLEFPFVGTPEYTPIAGAEVRVSSALVWVSIYQGY